MLLASLSRPTGRLLKSSAGAYALSQSSSFIRGRCLCWAGFLGSLFFQSPDSVPQPNFHEFFQLLLLALSFECVDTLPGCGERNVGPGRGFPSSTSMSAFVANEEKIVSVLGWDLVPKLYHRTGSTLVPELVY